MSERREILFRGKFVDSGEWVYGYVLIDNAPCSLKADGKCKCAHDGSDVIIQQWNDYFHEYDDIQVIPATVGQYTGLKDKNGQRIFEGDIVKYGSTVHRVVFENRYEYAYFGFDIGENDTMEFCRAHPPREMEIIGNIHDNPELLEAQHGN